MGLRDIKYARLISSVIAGIMPKTIIIKKVVVINVVVLGIIQMFTGLKSKK